jgi:hypothetical protein
MPPLPVEPPTKITPPLALAPPAASIWPEPPVPFRHATEPEPTMPPPPETTADIRRATAARAAISRRSASPKDRHIDAAVSGQVGQMAVPDRPCHIDRSCTAGSSLCAGGTYHPRRIGGSIAAGALGQAAALNALAPHRTVLVGLAHQLIDIDRWLARAAHGQRDDQANKHDGSE